MATIEITTYDTGKKCITVLDKRYCTDGLILTEEIGDFYFVDDGEVAENETVLDPCCDAFVMLDGVPVFRDYEYGTDYPLNNVVRMTGNRVHLTTVDAGENVGQCAECLLDEGIYELDTDGTLTPVD